MRGQWQAIACLVLTLAASTSGNFNLFLDQQEVQRLLGLTAELYYVREGVINEYALNFVVPVPAHIQDIYFAWQNIGDRPIPYSIGFDVLAGDHQSMDMPILNISSHGNVPTRLQIFRLRFPCTGRSSSEVDIVIQVNVTLSEPLRKSHDVTQLRFKRKKICLQDSSIVQDWLATHVNETVVQDSASLAINAASVYIAVGIASLLAVILLTTFSLLYIRKRKAMMQEVAYDVPYCSNASVYLAANGNVRNGTGTGSVGSGSYATIASFQKLPLTPVCSILSHRSAVAPGSNRFKQPAGSPLLANKEVPAYQVSGLDFIHNQAKILNASPLTGDHATPSPALSNRVVKSSAASNISLASSYDANAIDHGERLKRLAVPRFRITLRNIIQEGTFGKVYSGLFLNPDTSCEGQVLIKTVAEQVSAAQKSVFLNEGTQMAGLQHRHILGVIGCCMDSNNIPIIAYPWVARGNLKKFLTQCRSGGVNTCVQIGTGNTTEVRTTLMTQDVVDMAIQVVLATLYLHRHRVIHKDLAARNCVVDDRLRIKVTDTGLSRDLFPDDYHCLGDNENRPIKWMALESITRRDYSSASDVWSFGVLLWELTTLAQQPYVEVDPFEMESYLKDDYRLAQPLNCPDELFAVMACCWIAEPSERPTCLQLLACLRDFHTALDRFI